MEIINPISEQEFISKWRDDFSGNVLSDNWNVVEIGANQSINVSNSELRISSGTTASAQTVIQTKKAFTIPCRVFFIYLLTQRINNQFFFLEVTDESGSNFARFALNGTNNTVALGELANNSASGNTATITTPASTFYTCLELDMGIDEIKFITKAPDVIATRDVRAARTRKLPDPSKKYYIKIRVTNSGIASTSNTNLTLDSVSYQSYDLINVDVSTSRASQSTGEALPVIVTSQPLVSGSVNISDGGVSALVTNSNLVANAIYTGSSNSANNRNNLTTTIVTDVDGTLYVDQSFNGITWVNYPGKNCVAGTNTFNIPLDISNYRIRYVNGNTATTNFAIYTKTRI